MSISKASINSAESGATSVAPDLVKVVKDDRDGQKVAKLSESFETRFGADDERDYVSAAQVDVATDVLDRLQRSGLINDLDFARAWSTSRMNSKKISKRVLAQELRKKEVSDDLIAIALEEISGEDEYAAALQLGQRKARSLANYETEVRERRITSALARKGYNYGIISRVLREIAR